MMRSRRCCIPGCENRTACEESPEPAYALCVAHRSLVSSRSRDLLQTAARRLLRLERSWGEGKIFDEIAGRGRYLAFCALLRTADERVERAWRRVTAEAVGATLASPGVAPSAPEHRVGREVPPMARAPVSAIE